MAGTAVPGSVWSAENPTLKDRRYHRCPQRPGIPCLLAENHPEAGLALCLNETRQHPAERTALALFGRLERVRGLGTFIVVQIRLVPFPEAPE